MLIKKYINGFDDTDFHIDFYQSQNFTITIYKKLECLKELKMVSTIIDFGECYEKIKEKYGFEERDLIILISDFFNEKKLVNSLIYFFNPETADILPFEEICKNQSFIIEKSLAYYSEIDIDQAKFFEEQDIDIFNSEDVFFNDLCYYFKSPNGRDVPLKERILLFYPNITLCDNSCNNIGVNLTSMKAICECKLKEILDETKDASKLIGLEFTEIIDSLSLDVIKCYKTLFQAKYFINCYGGFISLFLIIIQAICTIIASKKSMYKLRRTTFKLLENYLTFLHSKSMNNFPPKKHLKTVKSLKLIDNSISLIDSKYKGSANNSKSSKQYLITNKKKRKKSFNTINEKINKK